MEDFLSQAIQKLKPTAEFSYKNRDYSTVEWIVLDGDAPTTAEIDATIKQIKSEKTTAKATAEGKLAALGLTTDDLRALGL
jgi:hypothetical protein